jgi:hypothetical protein
MSDLEPRRRGGLSRKAREDRAYTLVLATGGLALLTVVLVVLAVLGVVSLGAAVDSMGYPAFFQAVQPPRRTFRLS